MSEKDGTDRPKTQPTTVRFDRDQYEIALRELEVGGVLRREGMGSVSDVVRRGLTRTLDDLDLLEDCDDFLATEDSEADRAAA